MESSDKAGQEKEGVRGDGTEKERTKEGEEAREEEMASEEEGEWVEYMDSLGRSRRCLKEDLEEMRKRDKEMATPTKPSNRYIRTHNSILIC